MALTMVFALIGALLFALFVVPVLAMLLFPQRLRRMGEPAAHAGPASSTRRLLARTVGVPLDRGHGDRGRAVPSSSCDADRAEAGLRVSAVHGRRRRSGSGRIFPKERRCSRPAPSADASARSSLEFEDIRFISVQAGRNDSGTDPFPPSRMEIMIGPKPRVAVEAVSDRSRNWSRRSGKRLRDEFPTTRFNFTQPIIDSVTEDTNGTSANLAVEFSGPDSDVLLDLARQNRGPAQGRSRAQRREHRAGRAAAAARHHARIGNCARSVQRPHRGRHHADQHGPGRRAGRHALRRGAAIRHRRQVRPQLRSPRRKRSGGCRCIPRTACRFRCRRWRTSTSWTARRSSPAKTAAAD